MGVVGERLIVWCWQGFRGLGERASASAGVKANSMSFLQNNSAGQKDMVRKTDSDR